MATSSFQKGSGQYQCIECGKQTRETGEGESQSRLCLRCWNKAGDDNAVSDGQMSENDFYAIYEEHSSWYKPETVGADQSSVSL